MDLRELEQIRGRKVCKLFFLLLLNTVAMLVSLVYLVKLDNEYIFVIAALFYLVSYGFILSIPKNFENNVKQKLLPYLLKNIIKDEGDIKWQGEEFVIEDDSPEEKIIDKLEKEIEKRCTVSPKKNNLDNLLEYLSEMEALEGKETLTQAEELRLKEINTFIEESNRKADEGEKEKYNIRLQLLNTIENNNSLKQYSKEDLIKIEYLKKENQKYEESIELDALYKKEELSEDEKSRKEYLQEKRDEYHDSIHKRFENVSFDTDRGLCLYRLFNRSISYDDVFYGNYKGNEFIAIEGKEEKVFNGTVIRIPLKQEFNNTLLVLSKKLNVIPLGGAAGLQTNLHSMKLNTFNKHTIWSETSQNVSDILNDKFVQYVNTSNNTFSYMFKENYAYLIWPHRKDFFKLGSLFKKVDNQKQYQGFEQDLRTMLYEMEKLANSL